MTNKTSNFMALYDCFPGIIMWEKDINSIYKHANQNYINACGLKQPEDIIQLTDYDIPCRLSEAAEIWQQADALVMHTNKEIQFFEMVYMSERLVQFLVMKIPKWDTENNIIGTYACAVDVTQLFMQLGCTLTNFHKQKNNHSLSQSSYIIGQNPGFNLTDRQSECLFFTLRGKTCKEIAKIFNAHCLIKNLTIE